MLKPIQVLIVLGSLLISIGIGLGLGETYKRISGNGAMQKPVIYHSETEPRISSDTQLVLEQHYSKCDHELISDSQDRDLLSGKTLEEAEKIFTTADGYQLSWQDNTLIIRHLVDDWCPIDKENYRLKEYQGMVAVYKGIDKQNDVLLKVTSISLSSLPLDTQNAIREGYFEFENEMSLNDTLENFDEFQ